MITSVRCWLLTVLVLLSTVGTAASQTAVVSGTVVDEETGLALIGANVVVTNEAGAFYGDATAIDGSYSITGIVPGSYLLTVSYVGYAGQSVTISLQPGQRVSMDFVVTPSLMRQGEIVISTVSRRPEKAVEAPASTNVIEARDIAARPVTTPVEHIVSMPGVDVASTGLNQSRVAVRGFNNALSNFDKLLILVDNRNTHIPALRHNITQFLPVINEDIDRIELVLGPGSALYGPNAANGVMHIVTKSPFDSKGTTVSGAIGERNLLMGSFRHAGLLGDKVGYKMSGQYVQGTDWKSFDPAEPETVVKGVYTINGRVSDDSPVTNARDFDIQNARADLRLEYRPTDETTVELAGGFAQLTSLNIADVGALFDDDWRYTFLQGRVTHGKLFAQAFWNKSFVDNRNTYLLRTGDIIIDKSALYVGQVQHGADLSDGRHQLTYGVDVYMSRPNTEFTIHGRFEDDDAINDVGVYVQSETAVTDDLKFVAAARVDEHNHLENPILSPRAALVYAPRLNQTIRATYNRAFTTPSSPQLFLDINIAESLGPLPFGLRGLRVPESGLNFVRDQGGGVNSLYMQSPFNPAGRSAFIPAEATAMWSTIVAILGDGGLDISGIPAPSATDVGTMLGILNTGTGAFDPVDPAALEDIGAPKAGITNTFEIGYKGVLSPRWFVAADFYHSRVEHFVSLLDVQTPNVFLDEPSLAGYLSNFMPEPDAAGLAAAIAGIPVGVVTPREAGELSPSDLVLSFRNFEGDVSLYGTDLRVEFYPGSRLGLIGSYSFVSEDLFERGPKRLQDIALNAPKHKVSAGVSYFDSKRKLSATVRGRYVDSFPVRSGVFSGTVDSYTVVDVNTSYSLPFSPKTSVSVSIQNVFNNEHAEYIGTPKIGRLAIFQLTQSI